MHHYCSTLLFINPLHCYFTKSLFCISFEITTLYVCIQFPYQRNFRTEGATWMRGETSSKFNTAQSWWLLFERSVQGQLRAYTNVYYCGSNKAKIIIPPYIVQPCALSVASDKVHTDRRFKPGCFVYNAVCNILVTVTFFCSTDSRVYIINYTWFSNLTPKRPTQQNHVALPKAFGEPESCFVCRNAVNGG